MLLSYFVGNWQFIIYISQEKQTNKQTEVNVTYKSFQYKDSIDCLQLPSNSEVSLQNKYLNSNEAQICIHSHSLFICNNETSKI